MIRAPLSSLRVLGASVVVALATVAGAPRDAEACGGVFVQQIDSPASRQIVRDHRMAIAIGRDKTVVWDEVRLQGDPRDFVWITPVKPGTKVEIADEPWMQALDVSTQPVVYAPRNDSSGCALAGCAADEDTSGNPPAGSVTVVNEEVLGPYDSVTVRAAGDADAPYRWLTSNGYRLDDDKVRAILASYADQGFDFAALKLHATCNQTAMKPVRIVIPGTEPKILVRMALAGAQIDVVPITLFVIAEAPYHPGNYPFGFIDDDQLEWNHKGSTRSANSNYDELADEVMTRDARTWLVESVTKADLTSSTISGASYGTTRLPTPGLYEAYKALCDGENPRNASTSGSSSSSSGSSGTTRSPCPTIADAGIEDASTDGGDAGDAATDAGDAGDLDASVDASVDASIDGGDAGEEDGGEDDASAEAGQDAGLVFKGTISATADVVPPACATSDFSLATSDVVGTTKIYITRMRARISPAGLNSDLDLTPVAGKDATLEISNLHQVARYDDQDPRPNRHSCGATRKIIHHDRQAGATWGLGAAAAFVLAAWIRRKRRR